MSMSGLPNLIKRAAFWMVGKEAPAMGGGRGDSPFLDLWKSIPAPTLHQLIDHYKEVVYACASINASAVASTTLRLYVQTGSGQARPKCRTRKLSDSQRRWLGSNKGLAGRIAKAVEIEEVLEHPLLTLLETVNQFIDGFTLQEFTQLYQDVAGSAYWLIDTDRLGTPSAIWLLPPQSVQTKRDSKGMPSGFSVRGQVSSTDYPLEQIIAFRMPSLNDPYGDGWSPARALWESIALMDKHTGQEMAWLENGGMPGLIVSPKEALGPEEAERLERRWSRKFRRGGNGKILVGESSVDVRPLNIPPKDLEMLAAYGVRKEAIANGYGIPMAYLTKDTNLANLQAARQQHALLAVLPRCRRNEQRLNQQLCPRFDERLFFAYDNPVPEDITQRTTVQTADAQTGDTTINERREQRGLPPVEWGDRPWMPFSVSQVGEDGESSRQNNPPPPSDPAAGDDEKAFTILTRHQCREMDVREAKAALSSLGWSAKKIDRALTPVKLAPPRQCHCEHDSDVHRDDWHKGAGSKLDGHGRRLPRGQRLQEILAGQFRTQRREVLSKIHGKAFSKGRFVGKLLEFFDPSSIDQDAWNRRMADASRPFLQVQWGDELKQTLGRLGRSDLNNVWNVANPKVRDAVQQAAMLFSEETNSTTTLKLDEAIRRLRSDLAEGILGPENTVPELTRRVGAIFDEAEQYRAERIAVTESTRAVHAAQRMAAIESGVVKGFRWLLSADACEICQQIAAEHPDGITISEKFDSIGDNPAYSDIYAPPAHPHCMCTITEILETQP